MLSSKAISISIELQLVLLLLGVIMMLIWYVFKFWLFFGDILTGENGMRLPKQEWQRELNFLNLSNLKSFHGSWVRCLWNQLSQIWHKTFFTFFCRNKVSFHKKLHIFALQYLTSRWNYRINADLYLKNSILILVIKL